MFEFPKMPANVFLRLFMVSSASSRAEKLALIAFLAPSLGFVSPKGVFLPAVLLCLGPIWLCIEYCRCCIWLDGGGGGCGGGCVDTELELLDTAEVVATFSIFWLLVDLIVSLTVDCVCGCSLANFESTVSWLWLVCMLYWEVGRDEGGVGPTGGGLTGAGRLAQISDELDSGSGLPVVTGAGACTFRISVYIFLTANQKKSS